MLEHPIHSIFVHFPAGLIPTSVIFFILYLYFRKQIFELVSILLLNISMFFILLTIATGLYDWQIRYNGYFIPPIMIKFFLSFIVFLLGVLIYILRKQKSKLKNAPPLYRSYGYISLYFVLVPLVVVIGYLGGELVYLSSSSFSNYNINSGSKLFFLRCNSCHPYGQGISSAFIFPGETSETYGSANLINSPVLSNKSIFLEYVRHPKRMPPINEKSVTNEELNQIYGFIWYLKTGKNSSEEKKEYEIKIEDTLKAEKNLLHEKTVDKNNVEDTMKIGERIFKDNCVNCHPAGGNSMEGHEKYTIKGSRKINNSYNDFQKFLRNSSQRIKDSDMPIFSKEEITSKDVLFLQKYLIKSFWK
jgi:uncharacterized membrane protein